MTTPLPPRSPANDQRIMALPYNQLTDRQRQYADKYGLTLQPASPAPAKGSWMDPGTMTQPGSPAPTNPPVAPALPTSSTGSTPAGSEADRNALALIRQTLATYGLPDTLADWAWGEIVAGKGMSEVLLDLYQRPEFKAEFPEIDARQKAGLAPLGPGEIVSYRQQAAQMMRAAGLPAGFYDSKTDFTDLLTKDVSLKELSDRITDASTAAFSLPQQDRDEWYRLFGHGDLTAMFFDPDVAEPLLHKQLVASTLAGTSVRAGYGNLNADQALGLADLGVSAQQAQQGFGNLAHEAELFSTLPGEAGQQIGQQDQLAAQFGGNAAAQQRILSRARSRVAAFQGGGSFAGSQAGVAGLAGSTGY